ncbi:DUF1295 domain-containing protein [Derxia lacustris]|uniref:DUF1295 domain-containing protein n=1 Tax=Derxia lacustris TaxID=764842 RepID=UPI000A1753CB|nr:DUF1295 domain-containing protein [Derxia lacustris]
MALLAGLAAALMLAVVGWRASLSVGRVSFVDVMWGPFVLLSALGQQVAQTATVPRAAWVLAAIGLWALRLSLHIARRNRGQPEDRRYEEIRQRNEPGFAHKSLYLVFGLQAVLAWVLSWVAAPALASAAPLGWLDALGFGVFALGLGIEALADAQLDRFKADAANRGRVLDSGLWRFSRHPNYFGECLLWWGLWLVALAAGGAWTVLAPLMLTGLLLKVSGVALLEKDIAERRPGYRDYMARTSAFVPWWPRRPGA